MRRRPVVVVVALIVFTVVAVVLTGTDRRSGPPLSPESTDPDGVRAMRQLLDSLGADVAVGPDLPAVGGVVVVLRDDLAQDQADDLEAWVGEGGTLVVADPRSLFAPERGAPVTGSGCCPACRLNVSNFRKSGFIRIPPPLMDCCYMPQ